MSNVNIRQLKDPASNEVFYPQTDVMGLVHNGEYGVEAVPTAGSVLPVQSSGVLDSIIKDGSAFDLSAHTGDSYASLSAALTAMNALPTAYKKGGMSIKYVQTYDNNSVYVQYRLMKDEFSTTISDWQGVDTKPVDGSKNLVESGGVKQELNDISKLLHEKISVETIADLTNITSGKAIVGGSWTLSDNVSCILVPIEAGCQKVKVVAGLTNYAMVTLLKTNSTEGSVDYATGYSSDNMKILGGNTADLVIPEDAKYVYATCNSYGTDRTPSQIKQYSEGSINEDIEDINEDVIALEDRLDDAEDILDNIYTNGIDIERINNVSSKYISTSGYISDTSTASRNIAVFPIELGTSYTLHIPMAGNEYSSLYAFSNSNNLATSTQLFDKSSDAGDLGEHTVSINSNTYAYLYVCYTDTGGTPTLKQNSAGIKPSAIVNKSIDNNKLSADSVTNDKIVDESIDYEKLTTNAIVNLKNAGSIAYREFSKNGLRPIKILGVGNSWTMNSAAWLNKIMNNLGISIEVHISYKAACTLQTYYEYLINGTTGFTHYCNNGVDYGEGTEIAQSDTIENILKYTDYDIISFQQASANSGIYSTFQPYLTNLKKWVLRNLSVLPEIFINATWAYPQGSTADGFSNYNNDTTVMYNAVLGAYSQALDDTDIDKYFLLTPVLQQIRNISGITLVDTADGSHLGIYGQYAASCMWAETLLNEYYNKTFTQNKTILDCTFNLEGNATICGQIRQIVHDVYANRENYL